MKNIVKKIAFNAATNLITIITASLLTKALYEDNIINEPIAMIIAAFIVIMAVIGISEDNNGVQKET